MLAILAQHISQGGFQTGIPGICDECIKEQKPSERYYSPHNKRLAVLSEGCWETFRDVQPEHLCTNPKHGGATGELQREVF